MRRKLLIAFGALLAGSALAANAVQDLEGGKAPLDCITEQGAPAKHRRRDQVAARITTVCAVAQATVVNNAVTERPALLVAARVYRLVVPGLKKEKRD